MKRSPLTPTKGWSTTTWTSPCDPGAMVRPSSTATRPVRDAAPACTCTGVQWARGPLFARQHPELRVEAVRRGGRGLAGQPVAPPDVGAPELGSREVDSRTARQGSARRRPALGMDAAHPDPGPGRGQDEAVSDRDLARGKTAPVTTTPAPRTVKQRSTREAESGARPYPCGSALRGKLG